MKKLTFNSKMELVDPSTASSPINAPDVDATPPTATLTTSTTPVELFRLDTQGVSGLIRLELDVSVGALKTLKLAAAANRGGTDAGKSQDYIADFTQASRLYPFNNVCLATDDGVSNPGSGNTIASGKSMVIVFDPAGAAEVSILAAASNASPGTALAVRGRIA